MASWIKTMMAVSVLLALPACTDVKRELGVGRNSPDEFTVVKRAPLTLPPDYTLRPPAEGTVPSAATAASQAKSALLGSAGEQGAGKGSAESALLQKMGAGKADPSIRAAISEENGYIALENQSVGDKLIFWKDAPVPEEAVPASVVDPKAEAERLKKNKQEGKPVTEGDVPVIEKKQATIDKLF